HTARRRQAGGRIHVSEREKALAAELARATELAPAIELRDPPSALTINLIGLWTILRKEVRRVLRIWLKTIIPPAITMTLYFIIFGSLIGRRIGDMDGVPYTSFIAPGLIMMSVITNSFGNVVSSFFSGK